MAKLPVIDKNYINEMIETSSSTVQSDGSIRYERHIKPGIHFDFSSVEPLGLMDFEKNGIKARFDPGISDGTPHVVVFCPKCGKKNRDSQSCKKCGTKLPDPDMMMANAWKMSREAELLLPASLGKSRQISFETELETQSGANSPRLVDPIKMSEMMEAAGFENVQISSEYKGFRFQIVAEGKLGLLKFPVLVKIIDKLDEQNAAEIAEEYSALRKHSSLALTMPHFLYAIIAGDLVGGSKETFALRIAGGLNNMVLVNKRNASILLVADSVSRGVYPQSSAEKYVTKMREIIVRLLN